jgi:hypothetical protein
MKYVLLLLMMTTSFLSHAAEDNQFAGDMQFGEVAKLKVETAETDARSALSRGDRRLLAVYGYTVEVPGVDKPVATLRQKFGLRMLEGTSDAIKSPQDKIMNANARQYATKYNQIVIAEGGPK